MSDLEGFEEDLEQEFEGPEDIEDDAEMDVEDNDEAEAPQQGSATILDLLNLLRSAGSTPRTSLTFDDVRRLLRSAGIRAQIGGFSTADADDDEDDESLGGGRASLSYIPEPTREAVSEGVALLQSGEFGRVSTGIRLNSGRKNIALMLKEREMAARPRDVSLEDFHRKTLIPNSHGTIVATHDSNIYSGQYSNDSSLFYTCSKDLSLHIYSTLEPAERTNTRFRPTESSRMKLLQRIQGASGGWTITDSHLSPDNERLIYASVAPTVYLIKTGLSSSSGDSLSVDTQAQVPLHFADVPQSRRHVWGWDDDQYFSIWSCRFSADGNEIVAGGSGKIFVYDLLANRRSVKINAHEDDVNSCCWADTSSGNVLISASDDTFLKVWDRRSLGSSGKPSGVLIGHTEGITYVSPKGDGRYVISNGKDQALRLWDLRVMKSNSDLEQTQGRHYGVPNYDYRFGLYPKPRYLDHPKNCSVMSYRGHEVLRTLIRCHFSPAETTGNSYIYSGSANGKVHIWSLDGRIVQVLDRSFTLPMSFDPSEPDPPKLNGTPERALHINGRRISGSCVRDVSWHPQQPILLSSAWEGTRNNRSSVAMHQWKGLSKNSATIGRGVLEDIVQREHEESSERERRRRRVPGSLDLDYVDDDD